MRVLILTGKFGMGHCSAAKALEQQIKGEEPGSYVATVDLVEYLFPKTKGIIYGGFNFLVSKCSGIYNILNEYASKHSEVPIKKGVARKLAGLIEMHKPDIIVSTFPGCSQYISAYRKIKKVDFKLYTCVTDISVHEEWIAENTDCYFVGSENTKNILISMGVNEDKIVISGIPVRENFKNNIISFDGEKETKEVLIMGGGLGLIPDIKSTLERLQAEEAISVTIITGKNKDLAKKLRKEFPQINVVGFTTNVDCYMRKADLIVSKAGGITTFEAIYSRTPMYVMNPFLNQEIGNAHFIEEKNMGRVMWKKNEDIVEGIKRLVENNVLLETMSKNMDQLVSEIEETSPINYYNQENKAC